MFEVGRASMRPSLLPGCRLLGYSAPLLLERVIIIRGAARLFFGKLRAFGKPTGMLPQPIAWAEFAPGSAPYAKGVAVP
jgi:hypothetical protein